jgi:hypothetical protein
LTPTVGGGASPLCLSGWADIPRALSLQILKTTGIPPVVFLHISKSHYFEDSPMIFGHSEICEIIENPFGLIAGKEN